MSRMTAAASVVRLGTVLGEGGNGGKVGVTLGAENADGGVDCLFRIMLSAALLLGLGHILGLEGIKYLKDLTAFADSGDHVVRILTRAVHIRLMTAVKLDAKGRDAVEKFLLKMLGVVLVTAPRVGNVNVRATDILVVAVAHHSLNVYGDLAATVKLVPGNEKSCLLAALFKGFDNEKGSGNVTEVTYVDRTGGAYTCGANVFLLVRISADDLLRNFI